MAERAHPDDPNFKNSIFEERLHERYALCQPFVTGKKVLDLPCGTGWGSSILSGYDLLVGVDIAREAVQYGQTHFASARFLQGSMVNLPFQSKVWDVLICLEGLEHIFLSEALQFLSEAHRVLGEEGLLIVTAPLLKENTFHSTNPYHYYEFVEDELCSLLKHYFEPVEYDVFPGPDGPELRFVGKKRVIERPAMSIAKHRMEVIERASQWVITQRQESTFRFTEGARPSLMAACFAILTLEGSGDLQKIPGDEIERWVKYLQSMQDDHTGVFRDPLLKEYPVAVDAAHNGEYISFQMTYCAIQALDALGSRALYPLQFIERLADPNVLKQWFFALNWSNPWLESNRIMFLLAFLIYQAEVEKKQPAALLFYRVLDWITEQQDPETGLWGTVQGASTLNAVAAAYHFIPFYEYVRRPIQGMKKIIDGALSLQQPDGLFGPGVGGGACEDADVIDLLAVITKKVSYRKDEIKKALIRSYWVLQNLQNQDGGFGYSNKKPAERYRFSNWKAMEALTSQSDTWSTWFRLTALITIQYTYPDDLPDADKWTFRRWPALGYHREKKGISPKEHAVLDVWAFMDLERHASGEPSETGPEISVVIPYFNMGVYLPETLKSILNQSTRHPFEIIVVDDGSSEEYSRVILGYLDHPKIRVIRQENRGLAAARNTGIRAARGSLICCIDPDDLYLPDYFEKAVDIFREKPDVGMVSSYYQLFDEKHHVEAMPTCAFPELLVENRAMVSSMFLREAWEKVGGYDETLRAMQDWDFWIGIVEQGYRAEVIPLILFQYRVRADSMYTNTRRPEVFSRIYQAIVQKHLPTYQRLFLQVVPEYGYKFAYLSSHIEQLETARRWVDEQLLKKDRSIEELRAWVTELETAKSWLNEQRTNWENTALRLDKQVIELSAYIQQLESRAVTKK